MKMRIEDMLRFKKPARAVVIAAVAMVTLLGAGLALNKATHSPLIEVVPPIHEKIYLGMPTADVYDLFGAPDFQASGLMWFGYKDIGTFDSMDSFINPRIDVITRFNDWSISELINGVIEGRITSPADGYFAHSYLIKDLIADPEGFTVNFISLQETFLPEGEYNVRPVDGRDLPLGLGLSFRKDKKGGYELAAEHQLDWDIPNIHVLTEQLRGRNYTSAMYHFVGAIPYENHFALDVGTVVITGVAESDTGEDSLVVSLFPGATFQINHYYGEPSSDKPQHLVIAYTDESKNIAVDKAGGKVIPITDDLIGIYNVDENRYVMKFVKYVPASRS